MLSLEALIARKSRELGRLMKIAGDPLQEPNTWRLEKARGDLAELLAMKRRLAVLARNGGVPEARLARRFPG